MPKSQINRATPTKIIAALKKANEEKDEIIESMADVNTELWATITQLNQVIIEATEILKNALKRKD